MPQKQHKYRQPILQAEESRQSFAKEDRNFALCNFQMSKNFLKAINDIRRQRDKQTHQQLKPQKIECGEDKGEECGVGKGDGEMPTLLREKLKALADFKKKIIKQEKVKETKEKGKEQSVKQSPEQGSSQNVAQGAKVSKNGGVYIPPALRKSSPQQKMTIRFSESPGYSTILGLIKHIKIYICEINDSMVSFNSEEAYSAAREIFRRAGLQF